MTDLTLDLNIDEIIGAHQDMIQRSQELIEKAVQALSAQTHAHVVQEAQQKLHSRREIFMDNLRLEQIDKNTWAVVVGERAVWIEDGMPAHNQLQALLASPKAKTSAKGNKYLVIPFKHSKGGPSSTTPFQQSLVTMIKTELKARKIPYKGIERNPDGSAKTGLLHKFDINGPLPKQPHHSVPILNGIRIYQKLNRNPDGSVRKNKNGQDSASREVMTFRIASSTQAGSGKWEMGSQEGMHFLTEAKIWAEQLWETEIRKKIIEELGKT